MPNTKLIIGIMMIIASLARNYLQSDLGLCYGKSENALGGGKINRQWPFVSPPLAVNFIATED